MNGRAFLVLARLRIVEVTRSRSSTLLVLGVPVLILALTAITFHRGHPFELRRVAVVGTPATAPGEEQGFAKGIAATSEADARALLETRLASAVLVRGEPARVVVGEREHYFGQGLARAAGPETQVEIATLSRWGFVHYLFPGLLTMSTLIAGLFAMSYPMVRYRQNLFLKKLATTPLSRSTFVASQIVGRAAVVLVQIALQVALAAVLFDFPLTASGVLALVGISSLGLLSFVGAGLAIACLVKNDAVLVDVINAVILPLVLLSEVFFPADVLPAPLAAAAGFLPSTAMVRLLREVLLRAEPDPGAVAGGLLVLAAWTIVTFAVGVKAFRWHA